MRLVILAALLPLIAAPVAAQTDLMDRVVACAGFEDATQRHACFDKLTPELRGSAVTVFAAPKPTFGDRKPPPSEPDQVKLTVTKMSKNPDGKLVFTMEDGQVWRQIDTNSAGRIGQGPWEVEIRRGMLGSFVLKLNDYTQMKVRREK